MARRSLLRPTLPERLQGTEEGRQLLKEREMYAPRKGESLPKGFGKGKGESKGNADKGMGGKGKHKGKP